MIPTIAVVGFSGSGKTRIATALIEILTARGYRIAAVKHSPHGHQVDRPATDSARLFAAGASKVILSSPGQMTSIERNEGDIPLEETVASLDLSYDLVVAEGFKGSTVPKVLVLGTEELLPLPQNVIAVVDDHRRVADVPCYSFKQMDELATQIQDQVLGKAPHVPSVVLTVDGAAIPLAPFPSSALAGVVHGFLKTLKEMPPNPQRVRLMISTAATTRGEEGGRGKRRNEPVARRGRRERRKPKGEGHLGGRKKAE